MKPSIYRQIAATQIVGNHLPPSPRHWNGGLLKYKGRLWGCLRYHLSRDHGSRCATAMVALDRITFQPTMPAQHLNLPAKVGNEHWEDARLFMFKGEPWISYTTVVDYEPGKDYRCVMEVSRLTLKGSTWHVLETIRPQFGQNNGYGKEKNWIFFEHDGAMHCIYRDHPTRQVLRLEGDKVVEVVESKSPFWQWGEIRGGTPPVPFGDGKLLSIFHSSLKTEDAPHFRRYYGAAYVFSAKPPFEVLAISPKPIMSGSEEDGHGPDPRYSKGWKPFIPFPCGLVADGDDFLVSLGVNDWQCAVGRLKRADLKFMLPDGSDRPTRYFMTVNGSKPMKLLMPGAEPQWIDWEKPRAHSRGIMAPPGYFKTDDGRLCEVIEETPRTEEITAEQYNAAMMDRKVGILV